jgi:subtilisin family serine protease
VSGEAPGGAAGGGHRYTDKLTGRVRSFRPAAAEAGAGAPRAAGAAAPVAEMIDDEGRRRHLVAGEATVQFRDGVGPEAAGRLVAQAGARVLRAQRTPGYYTLALPEGRGLFETLRALVALDEVRFAEPSERSYQDEFAAVPDDPDLPKLWALDNTGQRVMAQRGAPGVDIRAFGAWEHTRGDPAVVIVVIDSGADLDHPDLAPNIMPRGAEDWDFADAADPTPEDEQIHSHGTHVAGTAAAISDGAGSVGVAPGCSLVPLRVDLNDGMSQNRADAINYATGLARANPDRRYVLNCSWGTSGDHAGVHSAIAAAVEAGAVVVFAAGNRNEDIDVVRQYPALYPEVIAVAATDNRDRKAQFSNHGPSVDVSAPGWSIWSTIHNGHGFMNGTSMAAPHVAGVAALAWSANPALSGRQVREIVEGACDDLDAANPDLAGRLGRGRVNASRAVAAALAAAPPGGG